MKQVDIFGTNRYATYTKTRVGCRGIVLKEGKLLVSREEISDYWMLPGGGLEAGETPEECCIREVREETGYLVEPIEELFVINEYYKEYRYISHYYLCRVTGEGEQSLTETEKARGLVARWVDVSFFVDTVSKHETYAETNEDKRGSYLREYTAIMEYLSSQSK